MSDKLDAYHRWLGIPPSEQPPDAYRLLGVQLFEDDPDVIQAAADRQMAHLRTYQLGEHSHLSQRLLNEVAAAKLRLLNPEKRAAYDRKLRAQLKAKEPAVPPPAPPPGAESPEVIAAASSRPRRKRPSWQAPVATAAVGAVLIVLVVLVVLIVMRFVPGKQTAEPKPPPGPPTIREISTRFGPGSETARPPIGQTPPHRPERQPTVKPPPRTEQHPRPGSDPSPTEPKSFDPVPIVENVRPSLVRVETPDGQGAGFVVDADGIVATSYRLVAGQMWVTVTLDDGVSAEVPGFVAVDKDNDLALIRIKTDQNQRQHPKLPAVALCSTPPRKGETVIALGAPDSAPDSDSNTPSQGVITAIRQGKEVRNIIGAGAYSRLGAGLAATWIQTSAAISPENRGGPLVNARGEVVAVNAWGKGVAGDLNFAISARPIESLLRNVGNECRKLSTLPKPARPDVDRSADRDFWITFPSGNVLSSNDLRINAREVADAIEQSLRADPYSVLSVRRPNGTLRALACHDKGTLDGVMLAFHENKQPKMYVTYVKGKRHGLLKIWDSRGGDSRSHGVFTCRYTMGRRQGFCCLMDEGEPRLVLEYSYDKINAVHVLGGGKIVKSYDSVASLDGTATSVMEQLKEIEDKLGNEEPAFKKAVRKEDRYLRKERAARLNPRKWKDFQARATQRLAEQRAIINALRQKAKL
jgi:S1-C subfamily serine protease